MLIKIQANLPPSRGLGSSAAVAVAFIRASYDYLELPLSDEELLENADWAERIAHGKPWVLIQNDCNESTRLVSKRRS